METLCQFMVPFILFNQSRWCCRLNVTKSFPLVFSMSSSWPTKLTNLIDEALQPGFLGRRRILCLIWASTWLSLWLCTGEEDRLEDCEIRLNGQLHGKRHTCAWNSKFVFVRCGQRNLPPTQDYWGGIRSVTQVTAISHKKLYRKLSLSNIYYKL